MELNYKSFGSGPALVILHGLFGSLDNWQTLAKDFAQDYSVYIVDQRNHGKSPHTGDTFTYPAMAQDLCDFLDQQGIPRACLIGHSMGGKTVMQFAAEWEDRVERMIVADMAPRQYGRHHDEVLDALNRFPLAEITTRKEAEAWMEARIPDFGTRQFLLKNLDRDSGTSFRWKFNLDIITRDYENILAGIETHFPIEVPTLFLRGGNSPYVKDEYFPDILKLFPEAVFDTIEGAGHWIHAEAPAAFYEKSIRFLRG